ncbi:hypothetical protein DPMN_125045 [Dreissena polymorpha]|uniref:Uncharacterized protein n=1 Tax=Dreissena polymorpha TaxID=45954 RepID=A0A9D4GT86_DREPO|nr:hypothetical protein DPMN_125045 [Dreissena polymorpha]
MVPFDFQTHSSFQMTPSTCPTSWLEMTLSALARTCRNPMDIESRQDTKAS